MLEILIIAASIVLDQLTKYWITCGALPQGEIIPGIINFTYAENTGSAFGAFSNGTLVLTIISALLAVVMAVLLIKYRKKAGKLASVALSMIIGGAIGNLIDRALQGFVTDFIEFDFVRFAIYNVADCFVVIGVILLMIYILFIHDKREAKEVK